MPAAPLVAIAGWLVPGAGYWLLGQRARAITVGATIITLFLAGTLIGGVRAIQVPGYGEEGGKLYVVRERDRAYDGREVFVERIKEHRAGRTQPEGDWVVTNFRALLGDVGNKPWSICQVMNGPLAFIGGAASVRASRPVETNGDNDDVPRFGEPAGALSHSRVNEIAVLYTAVAGMLNLLAIIDAAARAGKPGGGYGTAASAAPASTTKGAT
jgi:hypothetical protein